MCFEWMHTFNTAFLALQTEPLWNSFLLFCISLASVTTQGWKDESHLVDRPHTVRPTAALLQPFEWECLDHPLYSPDLAPNGFYLFGPLKKHLGGHSFQSVAEVQEAVVQWFHLPNPEFGGEANSEPERFRLLLFTCRLPFRFHYCRLHLALVLVSPVLHHCAAFSTTLPLEVGGLFRNVGTYLPDYTASHPRRLLRLRISNITHLSKFCHS